ncbi:hypothetical protein K439DRAFT_1109150 [Ramaria rubella]|nr:hypothetical protein K439DRAFT_1109150 [Ramaria rubella]
MGSERLVYSLSRCPSQFSHRSIPFIVPDTKLLSSFTCLYQLSRSHEPECTLSPSLQSSSLLPKLQSQPPSCLLQVILTQISISEGKQLTKGREIYPGTQPREMVPIPTTAPHRHSANMTLIPTTAPHRHPANMTLRHCQTKVGEIYPGTQPREMVPFPSHPQVQAPTASTASTKCVECPVTTPTPCEMVDLELPSQFVNSILRFMLRVLQYTSRSVMRVVW